MTSAHWSSEVQGPGVVSFLWKKCPASGAGGKATIVLNAKFDTYPMRKVMSTPETISLVADDFFGMLH